MSEIKSNCARIWNITAGTKVRVNYSRPKYRTDLRREGRFMKISTGDASLKLDGKGINAVKKALVDAGEVKELSWQNKVLDRA